MRHEESNLPQIGKSIQLLNTLAQFILEQNDVRISIV